MPSFLTTRLERLEGKIPAPKKQGRAIRVVANDLEEAYKLLAIEGFDRSNGDISIIRLIVDPTGAH